MMSVDSDLIQWKKSLPSNIKVTGLMSRSPTAYKWKALFRAWILRETVFWRLHDLLSQSYKLNQLGHGLGARILLRSALETLAILIHLNQCIQNVLVGNLKFHVFCHKTSKLLLGSHDPKFAPQSLSILTVLKNCEKRYPGIVSLYVELSESAHPSFEGLCLAYSTMLPDEHEAVFENQWMDRCGEQHISRIGMCIEVFQHEYDDVWTELMEQLESWVEANDDELEATKDDPLP